MCKFFRKKSSKNTAEIIEEEYKKTIISLKNRIFELETEANAKNDKIEALEKSNENAQIDKERYYDLCKKSMDKTTTIMSQTWTKCTLTSSKVDSGMGNAVSIDEEKIRALENQIIELESELYHRHFDIVNLIPGFTMNISNFKAACW